MQIAEAAIPLRGIPCRNRHARRTTPRTRLAEPRRDRLATRRYVLARPDRRSSALRCRPLSRDPVCPEYPAATNVLVRTPAEILALGPSCVSPTPHLKRE